MPNQALGFAELLAGGILITAAITGGSLTDVVTGKTSGPRGFGGDSSSSTTTPNGSAPPSNPSATGSYSPPSGQYGFFPAPGTNYSQGQEPAIASRLNKLAQFLKLHIIGISGYRTPQHSVAVGGSPKDPHTRGQASDSPGVENVPESVLEQFGLTRPFPGAKEADHIQLLG